MQDVVTGFSEGERVVIRTRLPESELVPGGPRLTDTIGVLTALDEQHLVLDTRHGPVRLERDLVVAARAVPPPPSRPGPPHLAIGTPDLQRAMVDSWPPVEREALGDWLLRASSGWTNRGNSVLAVGSPAAPLEDAVEQVERWYAARDLPSAFALAGPVGADLAADGLGALLTARGYTPHSHARTMTARAADVVAAGNAFAPGAGSGVEVVLEEDLGPRWLEAYTGYRSVVPGATEAVLTGSPTQVFASAVRDGEVVGLARLGVAHRWGGLSAVWVRPDARRLGLAVRISAAIAGDLVARDVAAVHLQVEQGNDPAARLYERLGFVAHHDYLYLSRR